MYKFLFLTAVVLVMADKGFGQFTFTSDDKQNTLEIGGLFSAYYNWRTPEPGYVNLSHNAPALKDMELDFWGTAKSKFVYELKVNFVELISNATSGGITTNNFSADDPGLKSGYIMYTGLPVHMKLGWDKLPYSQGNLMDTYESPFWNHDLLTGGDMFSRYDMGLTLSNSFWNKRVNLYAGAYSGLGQYFIYNGNNDASGQLEYIARADISTSKYDYKMIDLEGASKPKFRLGANIRYTDKTQPTGYTLPTTILGDYDLNIVNGKKTVYGFDASGEFKHFSAQFENQVIYMQPVNQSDPLYGGTSKSVNGGYVKAGGWVAGVNYYWQNIHSVFSVKYQDVNLNDLIYGDQQTLIAGYSYLVNGWHSCFKAEWYRPLKQDAGSDPLNYTNQFRIGWQIMFDNQEYSR